MGFTPQQVNGMTPWEFVAAAEGYAAAHGSKEDKANILMSDEEFALAEQMLEG